MAYSNIEAIRQALLQESLSNLGGQNIKGLLSPTQTALQAGLLGGMQQLAPYTGYTTTPTTIGQSIGAALMGAAGGVQKQKESDLTKALQGLELYGKLAPNLTDFQKNVKRFNEIDAIPEEQRTQSEKNEYSFLKDRLTDSSKETLSDFTLSVIKKKQKGEKLSAVEEDAYNKWRKEGDIWSLMAQSMGMDIEQPTEPTEPTKADFDRFKSYPAQEILNIMNNLNDKDANDLYDSLDDDKRDELDILYNNIKG